MWWSYTRGTTYRFVIPQAQPHRFALQFDLKPLSFLSKPYFIANEQLQQLCDHVNEQVHEVAREFRHQSRAVYRLAYCMYWLIGLALAIPGLVLTARHHPAWIVYVIALLLAFVYGLYHLSYLWCYTYLLWRYPERVIVPVERWLHEHCMVETSTLRYQWTLVHHKHTYSLQCVALFADTQVHCPRCAYSNLWSVHPGCEHLAWNEQVCHHCGLFYELEMCTEQQRLLLHESSIVRCVRCDYISSSSDATLYCAQCGLAIVHSIKHSFCYLIALGIDDSRLLHGGLLPLLLLLLLGFLRLQLFFPLLLRLI